MGCNWLQFSFSKLKRRMSIWFEMMTVDLQVDWVSEAHGRQINEYRILIAMAYVIGAMAVWL